MKIISKAVVNVETISNYANNKSLANRNQCTCIDTNCGCGVN